MRLRLLLVTLAGLALLPLPAIAQDKPTIVVRVASIDSLTAKGEYLATLVDEANNFQLFVDFIKSFTKGAVDGLDPKKPFGLYGKLGPNGVDSEMVVLVPIKDEDALLAFLKKNKINVEKQEGGLFKVDVPASPFPGYFRFANGYGYFTIREEKSIDPQTLPKPETILPADQIGLLTMVLDLEQVPPGMKKLALQALEDRQRTQKDNLPAAGSDAEKEIRLAALDQAFDTLKSIVSDGGPVALHLDANETKKTLHLSLGLAARPGTPLAKNLAALGTGPSVASSALPASIISASLNVAIPEKLRDLLVTAADKGIKTSFERIDNPRLKAAFLGYYDALRPTLKAGDVDVGFALLGEAGGKYALMSAMKVVKGADVEKSLKNLADIIPEADRRKIDLKLDIDKVGGVNIHSATTDSLDANGKRLFGSGTFYSAFRDDAVLFTLGEGSLGTLKKAIASEPRPGSLARLEVHVAKVLGLLPEEQAKMFEPAFKKVFGANPDRDRIALSLQGGKELKLELTVPDSVLQLGAEIRKIVMGQ
jgi:hypothetical protein